MTVTIDRQIIKWLPRADGTVYSGEKEQTFVTEEYEASGSTMDELFESIIRSLPDMARMTFEKEDITDIPEIKKRISNSWGRSKCSLNCIKKMKVSKCIICTQGGGGGACYATFGTVAKCGRHNWYVVLSRVDKRLVICACLVSHYILTHIADPPPECGL